MENSTGGSYITGKKHDKYFTPLDELLTLTREKQRTQNTPQLSKEAESLYREEAKAIAKI